MIHETLKYKTEWRITRFASEADAAARRAYSESVVDGNLLLNAGITEMLKLVIGDGSAIAFNAANARLGVGDSTAAEAAGQTDLQASTNKLFKGMVASYPQVSGQTMSFRASFGAAEANFDWREFSVDNGGTGLKRINRKVSSQGTKASGQVWELQLNITLS